MVIISIHPICLLIFYLGFLQLLGDKLICQIENCRVFQFLYRAASNDRILSKAVGQRP